MPHRHGCRWWIVLGVLASLAGCADKTSLLVEVSSTLAIPEDVNQLELRVVGDASGSMIERTYEVGSDWPHSVSLRPGSVESQGVTITVIALHEGDFVARRVVREMFVAGEERVVRIVIDEACVGVRCEDGQDCMAGRCAGATPDGGMADGGVDGGGDAGCSSPADCDDDIGCTVDTCVEGTCMNAADDTFCQEGFTCDLVMGCPPRVCMNDAECNDGSACNGSEVCVDMACQRGPPIDCSDADACTADHCERGVCSYTTVDSDGDTFGDAMCPEVGGVAATDCNDASPDSFPGAPEVCNGLDDDCNGECDEAFTCCRGAVMDCATDCGTTGTRVCGVACGWSVCSPPAEICNAADDDCNGAADDVFACVQGQSESCTTACGTTGTRTCGTDCAWSDCVAPDEACNGVDDDCSGAPDDTFDCVAGTTMTCTASCGSTGTRTCSSATCTMGATCDPPAEGCNGVDDDCDGDVDETVECSPAEMQSCTTTCGSTGTQVCSSMCVFNACVPPAEVCNGADDDCDGTIDDGFTCVPGATRACTSACGTPGGTQTCTSSCGWGACTPPVEVCNGMDDDCDTTCDETSTCCAGSSGSCATSCGSTGTRSCSSSCSWQACTPPAETCNGTDDDCDGVCDNGVGACCVGAFGNCTTTCGSVGTRTCGSGCAWGACTAPAETCNRLDDDCDMMVDEDFDCSEGTVGPCTTACGSTGSRVCAADCTFGACTPPMESCNGADDDCDGMTDEGCGTCGGCTGAIGVSPPGGRYDVPLGASSLTGSCGGAGSEGHLTFTLTAASDVFIATHQATIDTVLYVRQCSCAGAEVAGGCNDNADGRTTSRLRLTNLAAGTYNVIIDTKASMSGVVPVDIYITAPGAESDRCGNPTYLAPGTTVVSGTTCGFASDYAPVATAACPTGAGGDLDRVYYFVLAAPATVTFNGCTSSSTQDQSTFVRSVCTEASLATQLACNDDGCGGPSGCGGSWRSSVSATLGAGVYYFFADSYAGTCACGTFQYNVTGL